MRVGTNNIGLGASDEALAIQTCPRYCRKESHLRGVEERNVYTFINQKIRSNTRVFVSFIDRTYQGAEISEVYQKEYITLQTRGRFSLAIFFR